MGQKVNPIGIRLGISRKHNSTWYAEKDKYQELLLNDFAVREFLKKELDTKWKSNHPYFKTRNDHWKKR